MSLTIEVDRGRCSGAGECVTIAPNSFRLNAQKQSVALPSRGDDDEVLIEAAESCPYYAISVLRDGVEVG